MNNFKKVLSLGLVLVMVVATMMIVPLTTSADAGLTSGGGIGTKDDPYIVLSKDDLYALGQAANVDDSWVGVDVYVEFGQSFSATEKTFLSENSYGSANNCKVNWKIDGNGYTMTQPKWPLLMAVGDGANVEIKNLNINFLGAVMGSNTMGAFVGGIVADSEKIGTATVLIENCTVSGTLNSTYVSSSSGACGSLGGFVGQVYGGATLTIKNCENKAAMDSTGHVGGFVGTMWTAASTINIINCANKGTVKGKNAGAIFGRLENGTLSITDSYALNAVTVTENEITTTTGGTTPHISGLVGSSEGGTLSMTRCYAPMDALYEREGAGGTVIETSCYKGAAVTAPENAAAIAAITALAHAHTFDNSCDASCNVTGCTVVREGVGHKVDSPCDLVCKECGGATGSVGHQYDNACDSTCNVCGYEDDERDHVYDSPCDATCNTCGATRTVSGHYYEDDADMDCNFCGATRTAEGADNAGADTTTAAAEKDAKKKGCKKSIDSTYAVIALISVLGFAFVAKKREEN